MKKDERRMHFRDKRNIVLLKYAMQCACCGEVISSDNMSKTPALKEVEKKMSEHIETCKVYQFMAQPAMSCYSRDEISYKVSNMEPTTER